MAVETIEMSTIRLYFILLDHLKYFFYMCRLHLVKQTEVEGKILEPNPPIRKCQYDSNHNVWNRSFNASLTLLI
jgi:hypothetical protein